MRHKKDDGDVSFWFCLPVGNGRGGGDVDMRRRRLLGGVAGLVIWAGFLSTLRSRTPNTSGESASIADLLLQACPDRSNAIAVGKTCLKELPSLPKTGPLIDALTCSLDTPSSELKSMAPIDLRTRIQARVSDDFGAGRTVQLRGWILSETELQLCVLAALCSA